MVIQTATWVRHPNEAEVTSISELRVNNLIIQKALVLTAKAFTEVVQRPSSHLPTVLRGELHS